MEVSQLDTQTALKELIAGNARFTSGQMTHQHMGPARRAELVKGQKPFAVILTCADSRVPPEVLFDQGLGDIFVVRNAGNVVDPVSLGSIEYAVDHLHCPLVVVLGHDKCGAIGAAVEGGETHGAIGAIMEKIARAVKAAKATGATGAALVEETADANIKTSVADIKASKIIQHLIEEGKVSVIGAKYDLASGVVTFHKA